VTPFLIYALPRSGTAWLATFLDVPHEPLADMSAETLVERLHDGHYAGAVDTSAYRLLPPPKGVRCFRLERDPAEIMVSSARFGLIIDAVAEQDLLRKSTPDATVLKHENFGDTQYLTLLWSLTRGGQMPERVAQFSEMRIERDVHKFLRKRGCILN
jgi:hypothetical protein